jgi:hypothetical protein
LESGVLVIAATCGSGDGSEENKGAKSRRSIVHSLASNNENKATCAGVDPVRTLKGYNSNTIGCNYPYL